MFGSACHLINPPPLWHWGMLAPLPVLSWGCSADIKSNTENSPMWNSLAIIRINVWKGSKANEPSQHRSLLIMDHLSTLQVRDWCARFKNFKYGVLVMWCLRKKKKCQSWILKVWILHQRHPLFAVSTFFFSLRGCQMWEQRNCHSCYGQSNVLF